MTSNSNQHEEVKKLTGNALTSMLLCPKCIQTTLPNVGDVSNNNEFSWAVTIKCSVCGCQWNVCKECKNSRKPMLDKKSLYHHNYKHKQATEFESKNKRFKSAPSLDDTGVTLDESSKSIERKCLLGENPAFDHFRGENNKNYFKMQHKGNHGAAYLVGLSNFKLPNVFENVHPKEVSMHLHIAALACTLTRGQRSQLAAVCDHVADAAVRQHSSKQKAWETKIPTSAAAMRSIYVKGKSALLPNLPRPSVTVVDDHAYMSLKDCVADLLGHGYELDSIEPSVEFSHNPEGAISLISQTVRARRILSNVSKAHQNSSNVLILYITEWSDGFEPASSKGNRNSCWMKTVTIAPPPGLLHSMTHTYPIALGLDGANHEVVEARFAAELEEFRKGINMSFYHGGNKRNVTVYLEVFASLQDQPERRSGNFIMLGGSKFTAKWGLACDLAAVASVVPACSNCINALMKSEGDQTISCTKCTNWNTEVTDGLLDFPPPPDFPSEHLPESGKLSPLLLSYDVMKAAVATAHGGFVTRGWSKRTVDSYLRVHGLNKEAIMAIMKCATHCKEYTDAVTLSCTVGGETEMENLHELEKLKETHPELFQQWKFPAIWDRGVLLQQHIDVAMHLIFLGVVKTCIVMVQDWTKLRGKHSAFLRYVKGTLEPIQRLGLDWCRCVPYRTGKLGGWVSENYLGASRLLDWLYSSIDEIASDEVFIQPLRHHSMWNMKENRGWLSIHGLDTQGTAAELKQRVKQLMEQDGGPPEELPPQGGPALNVYNMIIALKSMVSRVMKRSITNTDINDAERHIKLFLTAFESFDHGMRKKDEKPTWITSYNFICLTNLPRLMREFGPLRNLWEGGGQGEKIIGMVKPLWLGYRLNWHKNLLDKLMKRISIDRVQETNARLSIRQTSSTLHKLESINMTLEESESDDEDFEDEECIGITQNKVNGKMAHKYKNIEQALYYFQNRKPVSVVHLLDGRFGCILYDNTMAILSCDDYIETRAGAFYHNWSFVKQSMERIMSNQISDYCLLLPRTTSTGMPTCGNNPEFTLIQSDWMVIQQDKTLAYPRILGASYSSLP
jgi:hypothetical protein